MSAISLYFLMNFIVGWFVVFTVLFIMWIERFANEHPYQGTLIILILLNHVVYGMINFGEFWKHISSLL